MQFLKSFGVTLLFGSIYFYFLLPPINITSFAFWFFIISLLIVFGATFFSLNTISIITGEQLDLRVLNIGKNAKIFFGVIVLIIGGIIVTNIVLSPLFIADAYSKRIFINTENTFADDIDPVDFQRLPVIDKDSSMRLGDRVMGRLPDLVSQFDVSNLYTQINYQDEIVRVTPLEYSDIFKYFNNRHEGVAGYIIVNSVSGEAELVRLDEGMQYMNSAILNKNLDRKLRFSYPTKIFGGKYFELDDEGNPFWVVPTVKYHGVNIRAAVEGVIILDPVSGDSDYYDINDVPEWIDHAYPSRLIIEKTDDWGQYSRGFWNSIFGQREVVKTTRGYNYTIIDNDVYLYTGITSVIGDEANLGFILTNLRTSETNFYTAPGAEEYSARASAEGQVQHMNYQATFPLLVNVKNQPTYFLSLKDRAGLIKMYALVDATDYQRVSVTDVAEGIPRAFQNYIGDELDEVNLVQEEIVVRDIIPVLIDGNSHYFLVDDDDQKYFVNINVNKNLLPFLNVGDKITVGFYEREDEIIEILTLKK